VRGFSWLLSRQKFLGHGDISDIDPGEACSPQGASSGRMTRATR